MSVLRLLLRMKDACDKFHAKIAVPPENKGPVNLQSFQF